MTPSQVQHLITAIQKVFPRNTLTTDELDVFRQSATRIDIDHLQAEAVIRQYRLTSDSTNPRFDAMLGLLRGAVQTKQAAPRDSQRNLLVDVYRRRFGVGMGDIDTARHVANSMVGTWGIDACRSHLREMISEFIRDDTEVWRLVFEAFPSAALQAKERERVKRTREKMKSLDARQLAKSMLGSV